MNIYLLWVIKLSKKLNFIINFIIDWIKNGARHLKEHPKMSKFTKFDGYWFKLKGMVHLVWIGGTGVLQSILSSLILKVYHAFAFKPITIKFGKFTNFWILFQMTCPIFNSIDNECSYPVPCSFRTWQWCRVCRLYVPTSSPTNWRTQAIGHWKSPQGTARYSPRWHCTVF